MATMATKTATILVIAPGPIGDVATRMLMERGHFVMRAADAAQASSALGTLRTDLVILDPSVVDRGVLEARLFEKVPRARLLVVDHDTPLSALQAALLFELRALVRGTP